MSVEFRNLEDMVHQVSVYDSQYTEQIEDIDHSSDIYKLRYRRNRDAAQTILAWLSTDRPDVVIVPNGTIMELGVCYHVARSLKIPTTTYEFSDQRNRFWMAQNAEVMRQNTDGLMGSAKRSVYLNVDQLERVKSLMQARQKASLWENFSRMWQGVPTQGAEKIRKTWVG